MLLLATGYVEELRQEWRIRTLGKKELYFFFALITLKQGLHVPIYRYKVINFSHSMYHISDHWETHVPWFIAVPSFHETSCVHIYSCSRNVARPQNVADVSRARLNANKLPLNPGLSEDHVHLTDGASLQALFPAKLLLVRRLAALLCTRIPQ